LIMLRPVSPCQEVMRQSTASNVTPTDSAEHRMYVQVVIPIITTKLLILVIMQMVFQLIVQLATPLFPAGNLQAIRQPIQSLLVLIFL
jgi:hypothetical protein